MATAGRKPTPTELKKLRGTDRADRSLGDREAQFPIPKSMPEPPSMLNELGQAAWNHYGRLLLDAGLLTAGDMMALEMLCAAYGRWLEAELDVLETGTVLVSENTGGRYQNPSLHVANKAWEQIRKMLSEFGLTPAERTRVAAIGRDSGQDELVSLLFNGIEDDWQILF
jgi:P27 family predicted phage terminase small subunit